MPVSTVGFVVHEMFTLNSSKYVLKGYFVKRPELFHNFFLQQNIVVLSSRFIRMRLALCLAVVDIVEIAPISFPFFSYYL